MTCIVGLIAKNGALFIGGDSAAMDTESFDLFDAKEPKVYLLSKDILIGSAGGFRFDQCIRYQMKVPAIRGDLMTYLTGPFISAMRKTLKKHGALSIHDETQIESFEGALIIGIRGRLFSLEADFSVIEERQPFCAVGVGAPYARAALTALQKTKTNLGPEEQVLTALLAAESGNASVKSPFTIERLGPPKKRKRY